MPKKIELLKSKTIPALGKSIDKLTLGEIANLQEAQGVKVSMDAVADAEIKEVKIKFSEAEKWNKTMKDISTGKQIR